jgi:peptide maturation system acyl carrier-related protein
MVSIYYMALGKVKGMIINMSKVVNKEEILQEIIGILEARFSRFPKKLNYNSENDNLFGKPFNLEPRDLLFLLYEIERNFNIVVPQEEILKGNFNTLKNITDIVYSQMN